MEPSPRPVLYLEVATYASLVERGDVVARWFDHVLGVVEPLASGSGGAGVVAVIPRGSVTPSIKPLSAKRVDHAMERFAAGEFDTVKAMFGMTGMEVTVQLPTDWQPQAPATLSVVVSPRFWPADGPGALQGPLAAAVTDFAAQLSAATAQLDVSTRLHDWEEVHGYEGDAAHLASLDRRLRACSWGTLLTAGHLAALGGPEAVRSSAPVAAVTDVPGAGLWLELTGVLGSVSDEQRAAWCEYLAPVLPPARSAPVGMDFADLVVEHGEGAWEALPFAVVLGAPAPAGAIEVLADLLGRFVKQAEMGVWGGPVHHMDPPRATVAESGEPLVVWGADMGSANEQAIPVLVATIDAWRRSQGVDVERLVIGQSRYW